MLCQLPLIIRDIFPEPEQVTDIRQVCVFDDVQRKSLSPVHGMADRMLCSQLRIVACKPVENIPDLGILRCFFCLLEAFCKRTVNFDKQLQADRDAFQILFINKRRQAAQLRRNCRKQLSKGFAKLCIRPVWVCIACLIIASHQVDEAAFVVPFQLLQRGFPHRPGRYPFVFFEQDAQVVRVFCKIALKLLRHPFFFFDFQNTL